MTDDGQATHRRLLEDARKAVRAVVRKQDDHRPEPANLRS